jgi:heptosyltransferase-1
MIRVLVIKPSSLGDIIHAAGAVRAIASARPDVSVTWVANEEYAEFVRRFPGVSDVLAFPRRRMSWRRFPSCIPPTLRFLRSLRDGFDLAVDLQGLQRSAFFARVSGAQERFGPRSAREFGWIHYNRRVDVPASIVHAIDRVNAIARAVLRESRVLGLETPGSRVGNARNDDIEFDPRLEVGPEARESLAAHVDPARGDILAICPGTRWESKDWPRERWVRLLRLLRERRPELHPVLIGAPSERLANVAIVDSACVPVTDLTGSVDLWTTAALLERAACAVTLDSAPLHLAIAVGTPTVSLFGPTDPRRVGPREMDDARADAPRHRVLRREELTCLGCYQRTCPLPERICLPGLEEHRVVDAIEEVIRR